MSKKMILLCLLVAGAVHGQVAAQQLWQAVSNSVLSQPANRGQQPVFIPPVHKTFALAEEKLRKTLAAAPMAAYGAARQSSAVIVTLPGEDGALEKFSILELPVMSASLAARYPQLKSYVGQGIDHPASTVRLSVTPKGFNAMITTGTGKTLYINPADKEKGWYILFDDKSMGAQKSTFQCDVNTVAGLQRGVLSTHRNANDAILRTYRFAVTVGGQFAQLCLTGKETTDAEKKLSVMSTLVTDLTRINGIFERDFGVHLKYVDNEDAIIFLDSKTDPFDDNIASGYDDGKWNIQCRQTLDKYIGNSNYDCGHLLMGFNTGGNAGCIGCVCDANTKGTAVTGYTEVTGDPFVVDFWSHEIGHQFGASHTFDYTDEGSGTQVEPGSGSTIMGYAGTTGATDVQPNSDDYFHAISIQQVTDYIKSIDGKQGPTLVPTGNQAPAVSAGNDYIIPAATPFALTGSATDADAADKLTYTWEQMDGIKPGYNQYPDAGSTAGAVFRSYHSATSSTRTFPLLDTILAGKTSWKWEAVPAVSRVLHFRFTVRDNHAGGGSNNSDDVKITVDSSAGPFVITAPDTAVVLNGYSNVAVSWNVANTNSARINCSQVHIQFSVDGGRTFTYTLADATQNDGSEIVKIPNIATTRGRIRIVAANNIFFDISNGDITVKPIVVAPVAWLSFTAKKSAAGVLLQWITTNETVNPYEVEKSTDGVQYFTIGAVAAGAQQYNFEDSSVYNENSTYRIKQLDNDGVYRYSAIAAPGINNVGTIALLYPNPAKNIAYLRLTQEVTNATIRLADASGKIVYVVTNTTIAAGQQVPIPVARLAAGIYFLQVQWSSGTIKKTLLVN